MVVVHGPPGVGKTTLIKNLIKHYVNQNLSEVKGPITVVSGKTRRLTFVECPQVCVLQSHTLLSNVTARKCSMCKLHLHVGAKNGFP